MKLLDKHLERGICKKKKVGSVDELVSIIQSGQIDQNTIYFIIEGADEHGVSYRIYPGGSRPLTLIHNKGFVVRDNRMNSAPRTQQTAPPSLY